ncbi:MAG TPA: ABC transporter substrate-binding protein [Haliangiales bacterium]|nr:ABC transporter substrate-binding protein [Haliangiales bacterium]
MKRYIARLMVVGFAGAVLLGTAGTAAAADELFVPVLVYRTGAYAPNGIPWADGFVDYLKLVNARDGGVNGVKLVWEECETEYKTDRGVECYERLKSRNPIAVNPLSTGITFALTDKVPADKIPLFTTGYGRSDSADGSVFQWNFPLMGTYWNAADILIQHVAKKEGGSLKGKKIALVYHDSPYGKEPIPLLEERAKTMGYNFLKLPVTHPGVEQKATWLQIRQERPDYVFLWGWGVMNSAAIKEAVAVGYPRSKMYGVWWAAAEPDVSPAEASGAGYNGLALQHSAERTAQWHKDMLKYVYDKGNGTGKKEEVGDVLYNRGAISAMLVIEAVKVAQAKFGKKVVTGEQVRWGAEHLNVDQARIKALGFEGMLQPIQTSCTDHVGAYKARIHTWDGKKWSYSSDWYEADRKVVSALVQASADKYAAEKKIEKRDCSKAQ